MNPSVAPRLSKLSSFFFSALIASLLGACGPATIGDAAESPDKRASCGDGTCDAVEKCSTCPKDCGGCEGGPSDGGASGQSGTAGGGGSSGADGAGGETGAGGAGGEKDPCAVETFTCVDVGTTGVPGSCTRSGDEWIVKGAGTDIWDAADSFYFAYTTQRGDLDTAFHALAFDATAPISKLGLMIRSSVAPGSAHAMLNITPGQGPRFTYRTTEGGQSQSITSSSAGAPLWLRLTRSGDTFTAFESTDGERWERVGSVNIVMPDEVLVGIATMNRMTTETSTARVASVRFCPLVEDPGTGGGGGTNGGGGTDGGGGTSGVGGASGAGGTGGCSAGTCPGRVYPPDVTFGSASYRSISRPTVGKPVTDGGLVYHRVIEANEPQGTRHAYSNVPAFNADGTLWASGSWPMSIVDVTTMKPWKTINISGNYRAWMRTDANRYSMLRVQGSTSEVSIFNWQTEKSTLIFNAADLAKLVGFTPQEAQMGPYEHAGSWDDKRILLNLKDGNDVVFAVLDIVNKTLISTKRESGNWDNYDWAAISPSGQWVVINRRTLSQNRAMFRYRASDFGDEQQLHHIGEHSAFAYSADGREGMVVMWPDTWVELADTSHRIKLPTGGHGGHVGSAARRPGWVYVDQDNSDGTGALLAVQITEKSPKVEYFGWHQSRAVNYDSQIKTSPSAYGDYVAFASDWQNTTPGLGYVVHAVKP